MEPAYEARPGDDDLRPKPRSERTFPVAHDALPATNEAWAAFGPNAANVRSVGAGVGSGSRLERDGAAESDRYTVQVNCETCGARSLVRISLADVFARLDAIWAEIQRAFRVLGVEVDSQHASEATPPTDHESAG